MTSERRDQEKLQTSVTQAAKRTAAKATETARQTIVEELGGLLAERRNRAAGYVWSIGAAIDAAAARLSQDGHTSTAEHVSEVGYFFEDAGHGVASYSVQDLVSDAARTAQRNPAVTFGLAALAGYAVVKLANVHRDNSTRRERA